MAEGSTRVSKAKRNEKKESSTPALKKAVGSKPQKSSKSSKSTESSSTKSSSNMAAATTDSSATEIPDDKKPVYFFRPHEPHGYLSNWYESPFTLNGETYATTEMWMMVQKARLFGDEESVKQMFACPNNPRKHKSLGRLVEGFDEKVWNKQKVDVVIEGNYHKFTMSNDADNLRAQLLATGDRDLVESSPFDRIWGIGFAHWNAEKNRYRWGTNLLGLALMKVRDRLREEAVKGGKDTKEVQKEDGDERKERMGTQREDVEELKEGPLA